MEELRKEFVEAAERTGNFSSLCREFGISRKTGYKWLERQREGKPLHDNSHRPAHIANRTPEEMEAAILLLRAENPAWGGKKLRRVLEAQGCEGVPSVKTVQNILKRNGCVTEEESLKHKAYTRFEKERCNEMWQTDFKGEFRTMDGRYCYPLNIIDDHSRFLIKTATFQGTDQVVLPTFRQAFEEFGMPSAVLSDNGSQFSGFRQGFTQFEKWLMCHDVLPIHGRLKHPQTQGKIERFHRAMKNEFLRFHTFESAADVHAALQKWRDKYNHLRPHEALGMKTPGEVYVSSGRIYNDKVEKYDYCGAFHVIKVNSWGYARFDRWQTYLSETMANEFVEFRPNPHGDSFLVCFRNFKIAEFSTITGNLLNRSISRL